VDLSRIVEAHIGAAASAVRAVWRVNSELCKIKWTTGVGDAAPRKLERAKGLPKQDAEAIARIRDIMRQGQNFGA